MTQIQEQPSNQTVDEIVNDEAEFEPLKGFEQDYEIQKEFPFVIKKKSNNRVLKDTINKTYGYVQVHLNGKSYQKHIIIAKQFIENDAPEHKTQVDHINHNRADNRLENLRWVSHSTNQRNRTSYNGIENEYVDEISDEAIVVDEYSGHQFNDYYYHDDVFYFFNGVQYRKLYINQMKNEYLYVNLKDVDGKKVKIMYSKFKKIHDLL